MGQVLVGKPAASPVRGEPCSPCELKAVSQTKPQDTARPPKYAVLVVHGMGQQTAAGAAGARAGPRHREHGHEAWIHGIIAEIAAQQDPPDADAAEQAYREAIRIADELGMRPRVALAQLGLARLYRRVGKGPQAAEHLAIAIASLTALRMPLWLEQARAS